MQRRILRAFIAMRALTLASCGGGGMVKRINPPAASVQQLRVADDGSWSLVLRINNFSTVPMTFDRLDATLAVAGHPGIPVSVSLAMDIPGMSAEVAQATVRGNAKLDPARAFDYRLTGTIVTSEPGDTFEFDKESRLEPVPGLPGEFR